MQKSQENTIQPYLDSIYVLSNSQSSKKSYGIALNHFLKFVAQKYKYDDVAILDQVKSGKTDVYRLLNEFVVHLSKEGKRPSSIIGTVAAIKGYLRYNGIKVYAEDCKYLVKMPKITRSREEPLTKEIIVRLLHVMPIKLQAAILFACSSGVRIGEMVQVRISDIDFSSKPTRVKIRAETTKTREARETYLTEEATKMLKDYLSNKFGWKEGQKNENNQNQVIFGRTSLDRTLKPKEELRTNPVFVAINVLSESLRWNSRNVEDLNRLNENGRKAVHFHAFRKFFRTTVGDVVGRDYAEALMGHHFYLDTYYNLPLEKRRETYLKAEPYLTISDFDKVERDLSKIAEKHREIEEYLSKHFIDFPKVLEKYSSS